MTPNTPPLVSGGLPVLGHALEMMRSREDLFRRGFAEHGDIFAIKLGPQYAAVVSGADHNKVVYTQTDRSLNMQEAYTFLKASIGEVLFTANKETYYNQRPVLQEVFRRERMAFSMVCLSTPRVRATSASRGPAATGGPATIRRRSSRDPRKPATDSRSTLRRPRPRPPDLSG